jgi:hypothetical protein
MEINNDKMKIAGLVVVAVLLILLSRQERTGLPKVPDQPAPPFEVATAKAINSETGTISGSITLPPSERQASVCAINSSDRSIFCVEKIKKDYSLTVPAGTYTVYATVYPYPRDINGYRAYYAENHSPIQIEVGANQTVTQINPNDWDNRGDETLIAQIKALRPQVYTKLAEESGEPIQPATPANPNPETTYTPQYTLIEQSGDSDNSHKRRKRNN